MPSGAKFCKASTRESPTMTTFVTPLAIQQNGLLRYAGTSVCAKNMCKGPPQIATRRPCSIYLSAGNGNAGNGISRNGASRRFSMESNAIQLMACDMVSLCNLTLRGDDCRHILLTDREYSLLAGWNFFG